MKDKLTITLESSNKIKNFILTNPLNSDVRDVMDFLLNSIDRIYQLLGTYKRIESDNSIAKIIVLRPLLLDSMLFLLLADYAKNHKWDDINALLNDCLAEGVKKQFYTFREMFDIEKLPSTKRNKFLNDFHTEFKRFFTEDSTIHNPQLKPKQIDFEITPENIGKKLKSTEHYVNFKNINHLYQTMSKYEHNTLVSLKLSQKYSFEYISYSQSESIVFYGYLNLLKFVALGYLHRDNMTCDMILDEYNRIKALKI